MLRRDVNSTTLVTSPFIIKNHGLSLTQKRHEDELQKIRYWVKFRI